MSTVEIRTDKTETVEFRASRREGSPGVLAGIAIAYNRLSRNLGGFVEQVDPGAARKCLADEVRVMARYNHEDNALLGTTDAGTLRLVNDGEALRYEIDLPATQAGRDCAVLAERGELRYSSFAFRTISDEWGLTPDGFPLRTLTAIQLVDVAPVNDPAYLDTEVGLRSLADATGVDPRNIDAVRAALTPEPPAGEPGEEPQDNGAAETPDTDRSDTGQVENHPGRDRLALKFIYAK